MNPKIPVMSIESFAIKASPDEDPGEAGEIYSTCHVNSTCPHDETQHNLMYLKSKVHNCITVGNLSQGISDISIERTDI